MSSREAVRDMMKSLRSEKIETWFDLGLFIDRVKDNRFIPPVRRRASYNRFARRISDGGVGFVTFRYAVDGVTIEIQKYARAFRDVLGDVPLHYIGGKFLPQSEKLIDSTAQCHEIPEIDGFDCWSLYQDFYFTKLRRGSAEYNKLITDFWLQTLSITEKLAQYIQKQQIELLYLLNVSSNPGNVALSLACVIISEYLEIPVINNNHDFYFEGGNSKADIARKGLQPGPRDFFFRNAHVGEFFSTIESLFPWDSRAWLQLNINRSQTTYLIEEKGFNPANIAEIGTCVPMNSFLNVTNRDTTNTFLEVSKMLSHYKKNISISTPREVLSGKVIDIEKPWPICLGSGKSLDFVNNNILFLQPTRLMPRKNIEIGFKLIAKLFEDQLFVDVFRSNKELTLTMLVTGPSPLGQSDYFYKLVEEFESLLKLLSKPIRDRIFLGLLFSEFDKPRFRKQAKVEIGIPQLYAAASLILLPSETEGRGLPIIEAACCGKPIFCRRYYPERVYAEVIGEHLPEEDRLVVLEYDGKWIGKSMARSVAEHVFFPQNFMHEIEQNRRAVLNRYSRESLKNTLKAALHKLHQQLQRNRAPMELARRAFRKFPAAALRSPAHLSDILDTKNREYLAGYGRVGYMLELKSLIDPSYFRVEEQHIKAYVMRFARYLVESSEQKHSWIYADNITLFYNAVESLFHYYDGEQPLRHDHSFAYRHRFTRAYPIYDYTLQEITGLVNWIFQKVADPPESRELLSNPKFFSDWDLALFQLTNSPNLQIDDRSMLREKLKQNVPVAIFPGDYVRYEIEILVLQPLRARCGLKSEESLTKKHLSKVAKKIAPIYIFCRKRSLANNLTAKKLLAYIQESHDPELKLLFDFGLCQVIPTEQWGIGVHILNLGKMAHNILRLIKDVGGFIVTNGPNAPVMTDILGLDRIHIGRADGEVNAAMMGVNPGDGFIQYVPAGIRTTLAYPTPVQTAKSFTDTLQSKDYKRLEKQIGKKKLSQLLREQSSSTGAPLADILHNIDQEQRNKKSRSGVSYSAVCGRYKDGNSWAGVLAKVPLGSSKKPWNFTVQFAKKGVKRVTEFVEEFEEKHNLRAGIAWNGGYILNAELVGKLGLSEDCIGSPLGLNLVDGKILCPPLFNKPAFLVGKDGKLEIRRVSLQAGLKASYKGQSLDFSNRSYNRKDPANGLAFYDLCFDKEQISADGRVIVQLAGNTVHSIISSKKGESIKRSPIGITLLIPKKDFPKDWISVGKKLTLELPNFERWLHGVEAGPLLVHEGKEAIDMKVEGWTTSNSIKTQAARLDFLDMRGPKIAAGLGKDGDLFLLAVNGRIRESVGATHSDMAKILIENGVTTAMGFDPGGSSTLFVNGKMLNISPYNSNYEKSPLALPPEARGVASALIAWKDN